MKIFKQYDKKKQNQDVKNDKEKRKISKTNEQVTKLFSIYDMMTLDKK